MKRPIMILPALILALSAGTALGQAPPGSPGGPPPGQGPGPGGFGQRRMQALLQGITLTAAQQARIDSIQARYRGMMPAFTPGAPPDSATAARRRQLTQQQDAEIRAVLTPEQQQVWDRNVGQLRSMPRRGPGG